MPSPPVSNTDNQNTPATETFAGSKSESGSVAGNVDPLEIAKFDELASHWWDREGDCKPLHDINPLRVNYIDAKAPLAGKRVLDIGCGGGILSEAMAQRGARVTAIDMGAAALEVARQHALDGGLTIDYRQTTAEDFARDHAGQFDIITCLEMLEHVPDPASIINAAAKLTRPGGDIFLSTINRNPKAWLFAVVGAEHVLNLLPRGTHDYARFIKPSELAGWLRAAGLALRDTTGMTYNPVTRTYSLIDNVQVNYLAHAHRSATL